MGKAVDYARYLSSDNKAHVIEHAIEFEEILSLAVQEDTVDELDAKANMVPELKVLRRALSNHVSAVMLMALSNREKFTNEEPDEESGATFLGALIMDNGDIIGSALLMAFYFGLNFDAPEHNPFLDD